MDWSAAENQVARGANGRMQTVISVKKSGEQALKRKADLMADNAGATDKMKKPTRRSKKVKR